MGDLVSVIIPTYNRSGKVTRAVESVLAQSYSDIEVIVVDDGSTDDTKNAIAEYAHRVIYLEIAHHGHPGISRNTGWRAAHGEFVAFLDDDDEWLPEKLKKQMDAIAEFPVMGFVCSNAYRQEPSREHTLFFADQAALSGWLFTELLIRNFVVASSMLVRKSFLEQAGVFNERNWSRGIEDYDLWLRVSLCTQGIYLSEPLVIYHDSPGTSIRGTQTLMRYWHNLYKILRRVERFMKQKKISLTIEENRILLDRKRLYINAALQEALSGKFRFNYLRFRLLQIYWNHRLVHFLPRSTEKEVT